MPQACTVLCHACQTETPLAAGESIGFRETCDRCAADLHVCLNCVHVDPSAYNGCRESSAERVLDPGRANRCDYFRAGQGTKDVSADSGRNEALAKLDNLFKD